MRKFVLLFGACLLAILSMLLRPGAQAVTGTVTVIHGIPGLTVDVYVNASPSRLRSLHRHRLDFLVGTYRSRFALERRRRLRPVLAGSATLPAAQREHRRPSRRGQPKLTVFVNDTPLPGSARLVVRHTAAAPAVDVLANGKPAFTSLTNPNEAKAELPAGTVSASVAAAGTTTWVIGPVDLTLPASTITVVYAVGSLDGKALHTLVQNIPGSTTPAPTAPAPAPPADGQLPQTGSSTGLLVAIGLGSLVAGVIVTRRFATR